MTILQQISLYIMAAFYTGAGINHFVKPKFYLNIMPSFLPMQEFLVSASGVAEILLGIGLLFSKTRLISSWLIIAMLISFFLIHVPHLFNPPKLASGGRYWLIVVRFFLQFVLIYWAWVVGKYK